MGLVRGAARHGDGIRELDDPVGAVFPDDDPRHTGIPELGPILGLSLTGVKEPPEADETA